jgi:hypothetical protein
MGIGDLITLTNSETVVKGKITGMVVKNNSDELERIYINAIEQGFWLSSGWKIQEEEGK